MGLLDGIDPQRHDAMAVLDAANGYGSLSNAEQDEEDLWEYAGMNEAQHPLIALLPEAHNGTCIVRDLDGELKFLWEEAPASDRWLIGPLFREHLIEISDIEEAMEEESEWLVDRGISVSLADLSEVLSGLPEAPGPVMRL
jgi:hypothetical protein